ncbi:unnamed protein product [Lactuca saligna]|uniref:Reverse transcriptase Ty1/copia-type domain-containing protein n=1 Tax=Lactuca saligna TaxID=75948 RepID=A0AA35Y7C1_LACSI|nr:unnamed protein product [Lactuca saligna]
MTHIVESHDDAPNDSVGNLDTNPSQTAIDLKSDWDSSSTYWCYVSNSEFGDLSKSSIPDNYLTYSKPRDKISSEHTADDIPWPRIKARIFKSNDQSSTDSLVKKEPKSNVKRKNHGTRVCYRRGDASHKDELNEFKHHCVWTLVPKPQGRTIIGTCWVFRNNMDEDGILIRNKARLVAQGFCQLEGFNYDDMFAPVARLEAICFFYFDSFNNFDVYQMDVKTAFLH